MYCWSFFHSLTYSIWTLILLGLKSQHTQIWKQWDYSHSKWWLTRYKDTRFGVTRGSVALKASQCWAAGGDALPVGGVDVSSSPLQRSGCSHQNWSCNTLWKNAVYMHISPLVTTEEGFSLLLPSLRCQAYWIIELFCSFEHGFKIGTRLSL